MRTPSKRTFSAAVVLISMLFPAPARATWSIVVTDAATGEVAIGAATCVNSIDLERYLPVLRVGLGAGVAQALVNQSAANRKIIFAELALGTPPAAILAKIQAADSAYQSRQFGIVDLKGEFGQHTGTQNGAWAGGTTGTVGTMAYAIQGNVLTGAAVVARARQALVQTPGDLATKLDAAMEAARSMGGDGRCSCSPQMPTSCGSPPPTFTKSAHVGFMMIARVGDLDGVCTSTLGCANGDYYMNLNVKGNQSGQLDPVTQLHALLQAWRTSWLGRPDHLLSKVTPSAGVLPAGGAASGVLTIQLADWQGTPLAAGGANVAVLHEAGSDGVVTLGAPVDLGNGTYRVPYLAGLQSGKDVLRVVVDDGQGPVSLYPFTEVAVAPAAFLSSGVAQVSASQGDDVPIALNGGKGLGGRGHLVLISASGTAPGFSVGSVQVPLVLDAAVGFSFLLCGTPSLPNTCGTLDANGAATAAVLLNPNDLAPLVSGALHFAAVTLGPIDFASDPVTVNVLP